MSDKMCLFLNSVTDTPISKETLQAKSFIVALQNVQDITKDTW